MSIDQREAINVAHFGAVGDGVTDDTAAFQAALDRYGAAPAKSGAILVPIPPLSYKITNTLFAEGTAAQGLRIRGGVGRTHGPNGSVLKWFGHPGAGMFHFLGLNGLTVEHLEVTVDASTRMKWGILHDATNTYASTVTVNTSSLNRASNIVTVTTATAHGMTPGMTCRIAGASNSTFHGTFIVLTVPTTTTLTYIQTGSNASATGGTTSQYKSATSSGSSFRDITIGGTSGAGLTVSSVSRNGTVGTLTTSTAHYALPGDKILLSGVTDSSFNGYFIVDGITSATVLTYLTTAGSASSSGGTVIPDSYGMVFGHVDTITIQVSEVSLRDVVLVGFVGGESMHGLHWFEGGNVKNYEIHRGSVNRFNIGVDWTNASGTLIVNGMIVGECYDYDFLTGSGTLSLIGVETESDGARFIAGTTGANPGHINMLGCSVESGLPTDDIAIDFTGTLQIVGCSLYNNRDTGTYSKIRLGSPAFGGNDTSSLVSIGNHYHDAPAGYVPIFDGSGNQVLTGAGYYANRAVSVVSIGDTGGPNGGLFKLKNVMPMTTITSQRDTGVWIPATGFQRWASDDVAKIANNAGNADLNLLSKDSSDVVQVGDTGGMKLVGPLTMGDAKNIVLNTTTGTKIGTATTQKLGFYNVTPIVQPTAIADADGTLADLTTKYNSLLGKLESLGLLAP